MKVTTTTTILVSLSEQEAKWLKAAIQNPVTGTYPEVKSFLEELFDALPSDSTPGYAAKRIS